MVWTRASHVITPRQAGPRLINFFKQMLSMASDSSSGFDRGITQGERKNKRTNTVLGQLQAQEREFYDTFHSPCICRLSPSCILRETSTKATRNANSSLTVFPHCHLQLTILPLDCYITPTVLLCSLLLTASLRPPFVNSPSFFSGTFLSSSTSGLAGDLIIRPFVWVSRQSRQRDSLTSAHTPNTTNGHIVSHSEWFI